MPGKWAVFPSKLFGISPKGDKKMKRKLQRVVSVVCALALMIGCGVFASLAESTDNVTRYITVEWVDEDNYDNLRKDVSVSLGGQPAIVLNEGNSWTGEASAPAGSEWEIPEVDGYVKTSSGTDITVVTYTHAVRKTVATATVRWDESDTAVAMRPSSVQVRLLADGKPFGAEKTANTGNSWTVTWENLPVTKKGSADPIAYSVEEVTPDGFTASVSGLTITNTLQTGTLSLQATVSGVPEGADVSGLKLTVTGPDPSMPRHLTYGEIAGGTYSFGSVLPGAYVVQEENADSLVEGYEMDPANSRVGDAVLVKNGEAATLVFRYAYREPVPAEPNEDPMASVGALTFTIDGPDPRMPVTVTYSQFENGQYTLDDLVPGTYYVVERNAENLVNAYTLTSDSVTGMMITVGSGTTTATLYNRYIPATTPEPEIELISIPVTKTWNDDNNRDGNRPQSVTVNLYADGVPVDSAVISADGGWVATFVDMPRCYEDGTEIKYTVDEDPVDWYASVVNGYNITNNYQPVTTSSTVTKVWDDGNNYQGIRPKSLAVILQPVGTVYILNADNNWTVTAENLPIRIKGELVQYSWAEQESVGYVAAGVLTSGDETIFTNRVTRVPETPDVPKKPTTPGEFAYFEEYKTALGIETIINHVGDCFD